MNFSIVLSFAFSLAFFFSISLSFRLLVLASSTDVFLVESFSKRWIEYCARFSFLIGLLCIVLHALCMNEEFKIQNGNANKGAHKTFGMPERIETNKIYLCRTAEARIYMKSITKQITQSSAEANPKPPATDCNRIYLYKHNIHFRKNQLILMFHLAFSLFPFPLSLTLLSLACHRHCHGIPRQAHRSRLLSVSFSLRETVFVRVSFVYLFVVHKLWHTKSQSVFTIQTFTFHTQITHHEKCCVYFYFVVVVVVHVVAKIDGHFLGMLQYNHFSWHSVHKQIANKCVQV